MKFKFDFGNTTMPKKNVHREQTRIVRRCAVANCDSFYMTMGPNDRKLFNIPKDEHVRDVWIANMRILHYTKTSKICDLHFEDHCFNSTLRNRLIRYAVPTILPGFFDASDTYVPPIHTPRRRRTAPTPKTNRVPITDVTVEVTTSDDILPPADIQNTEPAGVIVKQEPETILEDLLDDPPETTIIEQRRPTRKIRRKKYILQPSHQPKILIHKYRSKMHNMRRHMQELQSTVNALKNEIVALKTNGSTDSE